MNMVDHAIAYNDGWKTGQDLLKMWQYSHDKVNAHFPAECAVPSNAHARGIYDCIVQWKKSGESEMIKIACVVIVIDPETGHVLAATRRGTDDDWGFIGGKTDGEPPLDAAVREFSEETGWDLIAVPDYIGKFVDEEGWDIHVFIVLDNIEARMICDEFRDGPREVEAGILVGLVPYSELMVKTFAQFNIDLLPYLLKTLL